MNNKTHQFNLIKRLSIPMLRETTNEKFECKCVNPECFSKDGSRKGGFFWSSSKNSYIYHCFKCGLTLQLNQFLKEYFREEYINIQVYKKDRDVQQIEPPTLKIDNDEIKSFIKSLFISEQIIPLKNSSDEEVWNYVTKRNIPDVMYSRLYVAKNFFNINQQIKNMLHKDKQFEMKDGDDKRLMWMFKTLTGDVLALQGRRVDGCEPRYLITRLQLDENRLIGGLEYVNPQNVVYITEGYIDSLFLPNAVSLNGLHLPSIKHLIEDLKLNVVVVFDNEPNNKQIQKNLKELSDMSISYNNLQVCLFPKELRNIGKDVNDYILSGMSSEEILNIINNNSYSGSSLKVRSVFW